MMEGRKEGREEGRKEGRRKKGGREGRREGRKEEERREGRRKENQCISSYVSDSQLMLGVQEISLLNLFSVNLILTLVPSLLG